MLKTLSIRNLVLVEEAQLEFESGLTVITGETGAGKTALIEALRLILGERADASKVRKGAEKAYVCGSFEGELHPNLLSTFGEFGIPFPENEPLIISREISVEGKNRACVSGQAVPLAFLGKIAPLLIDFIGQHAQILMKNENQQRLLLDQFGAIDLSPFQTCLRGEKDYAAKLDRLIRKKAEQSLENLQNHLEDLEQLNYTPDEDKALFEEFSLLSNSEEITARSTEVVELTDRALGICHDIQLHLDKLPLDEGGEMVKEAHLQLLELQRLAHSLSAKMDCHPDRLTYLEGRLSAIDGAKKRFGKDLEKAREQLRERVEGLSRIDEAISEAENLLAQAKEQTDKEAHLLTRARKSAAGIFADKLSSRLQKLNIEAAEVQIAIEPSSRTLSGENQVVFHLRANRGEKIAPVKESSSGGEISRLLFCIKLILADQVGTKTLVFDEIDAGVGGQTAALMGEQMSRLAEGSRILCVTHFPQVARHGQHHIRVAKFEQEGRTLCSIKVLQSDEREVEYLRMIGGAQKKGAAIP